MKKSLTFKNHLLALGLAAVAASANAADGYLTPTPYAAGDQPFASTSFDYWYLENFDDGLTLFNGIFPASNGFALGAGPQTDSVDGPGTGSFYANSSSVTFSFDVGAAGLNGRLPTHVGLVWTDVGAVTDGGQNFVGPVQFEAFDQTGTSLGVVGPLSLGDGITADANTSEDTFFGVIHEAGISRITVSMLNSTDWELDDLQIGVASPNTNPVPIPAGVWLLGSGLVALSRYGKRASSSPRTC